MITEKHLKSDLGVNSYVLQNISSKYNNAIFVDLGVRTGISSEIMLFDSKSKNNKVYGVDIDFSMIDPSLNVNENYTKILGDSVTVGKKWEKKIDGLFIDTFHIKEQVLMELYFWFNKVNTNGFIFFHDTNWPIGKNDNYGNITWGRVEEAIFEYFQINDLNYEDDYIKISNYPESWGMTVVEIKKEKDYNQNLKNWSEVFEKRNKLISLFFNNDNIDNLEMDLNLVCEN